MAAAVRSEVREGIATLVLDRAEALNALGLDRVEVPHEPARFDIMAFRGLVTR